MNLEIGLLLLQDALTNGAIYVLMALGIVLVFNVTRIAFISFGDLIAYSSLTLATLQSNQLPGTVWLTAMLSAIAIIMETARLARAGMLSRLPRAALLYVVLPLLPVALAFALGGRTLPLAMQILLTVALVLPIGPLLYRVVFQPIAGSSVLVLLMAAIALHFALSGLALLYFGPEGQRTASYLDGALDLSGFTVSYQNLLIMGSAVALAVALLLFFSRTLMGKALRATAINRVGAQLSGIRTTRMSAISFLLAGLIAALTGVLIGPVTTVYYDTGFLVGLKGFVGAILGGFVNYPLAALGGILVGLLESYSSFYSSALKDVIVFGAIVPITILRWYYSSSADADDEEYEET
jgi:branched-chain amino acid transport system permease protein